MAILLNPASDRDTWFAAMQSALAEAALDLRVDLFPDIADVDAVEFLVAWRHPAEDAQRYPNLKAILVTGAGIEQYLTPGFPDVPIVRLADPIMSEEMAQYAMHWVMHFQRKYPVLAAQQQAQSWEAPTYVQSADHRVGILGYGTIGARVGAAAQALGFPVNAWSRRGTADPGVTSFAGEDQLADFLAASDSVISVLPSSTETRHVMNAKRFAECKPGAVFINMGRGATVDEVALIDALDNGPLDAAVLDVFETEPLPTESPLWSHPDVVVTPHVAGSTQCRSAARVIVANIERIRRGEEPFPMLDRSRGY